MGVPLKKMYINQATAELINASREIAADLRAAIETPGSIFLLRPGHKAPEESLLQRI